SASVSHRGLIEQACARLQRLRERDIAKMLLNERPNLAPLDKPRFWRNLLVVADNNALLSEILKEQTLWAGLAGLVNNDDIEYFRFDLNLLGNAIERHDPYRNRITALLHKFSCIAPVCFRI